MVVLSFSLSCAGGGGEFRTREDKGVGQGMERWSASCRPVRVFSIRPEYVALLLYSLSAPPGGLHRRAVAYWHSLFAMQCNAVVGMELFALTPAGLALLLETLVKVVKVVGL